MSRSASSQGGRVAALIAAAGEGRRLGLGPKAFVRVGGLSLVEIAVRSFFGAVDEVIVALPAGAIDSEAAQELGRHARVIAGGPSRQETVGRLLALTEAGTVLVHDAARPFLTREVLARVIEAARRTGAATAALPVADTLFDVAAATSPPRESLRAIQTPQGFSRALLFEAHRRAREQGLQATDDAALVRHLGIEVELVTGSPLLAKVTEPGDLSLAEALLGAWLTARGGDE